MLATFAIAFGLSGLACAGAFLASYAAENGLPFDLPALGGPRSVPAPVPVPAPARPAPIWCEATSRWRDPVTRSFVKAPRA